MTDDSRKAPANHAPYTASLPSDINQAHRNSLAKALEGYSKPLEETPPELSELLRRLAEQEK